MSDTKEITKALQDEKLVIGTETVLKGLKIGSIKKVFVTANAPDVVKDDVAYYAKLAGAEVEHLELTNEGMKELCKKQYNISLVGI
ncbi:MAG: ribosomal L7Ae/L30e/S12e/Gadd45 family protein [Candidatus Woesearchaeota archaeon]